MPLTQVQRLESLKQQEKKSEESTRGLFQQTLHEAVRKMKPYNQESKRYKWITRKLAVFVAAGNVACK